MILFHVAHQVLIQDLVACLKISCTACACNQRPSRVFQLFPAIIFMNHVEYLYHKMLIAQAFHTKCPNLENVIILLSMD